MVDRIRPSEDGSTVTLAAMLAPSDVARYLGLSPAAVHVWLHNGTLNAARVGDQWRIAATSLVATIETAITQTPGVVANARRPDYSVSRDEDGVRVPVLLRVHQLAEHLGLSEDTIRRQILAGRLPAIRLRGRWYIVPADARVLLRQRQKPRRTARKKQ